MIASACDNGIAFITLGEATKGLVLNADTISRLLDALLVADTDASVRGVVLRSAAREFCLGMDLESAIGMSDPVERERSCRLFADLLLLIVGLSKPVVAVLQGETIGGGIGLAGACDIVIASDDATLQFPEALYGLVPAMIAPILCPRRMTEARLTNLAMTALRMDARTARSVGLVDEVASTRPLESTVRAIVRSLMRSSPQALGALKQRVAGGPNLRERMEIAVRELVDLLGQDDPAHAYRAYAKGELPRWSLRVPTALKMTVGEERLERSDH